MCEQRACVRSVHACVLRCFSPVRLFATLSTVTRQASLFMGFSRQEYWSELPCPPPGDLPDPGIEPAALHCRWILCPLSHLESPNREEKVKMGRAMKRKTKENVK